MTAVLWITAVLVLLGFVDIVLRVAVVNGKPEMVLSVLCFRKKLLPGEKKAKAEEQEKDKSKKKTEPQSAEEKEKKDPFFGSVAEAVELIRNILSPVGKFITGIRIANLRMQMSVGGSDAAVAAIRYGQMQAAVHLSLTALRRRFRVKAKEIALTPNFFTEKITLQLSFQVRISIGSIFIAACRALGIFIRHFIKYKGKKLRKGRKKPATVQEES